MLCYQVNEVLPHSFTYHVDFALLSRNADPERYGSSEQCVFGFCMVVCRNLLKQRCALRVMLCSVPQPAQRGIVILEQRYILALRFVVICWTTRFGIFPRALRGGPLPFRRDITRTGRCRGAALRYGAML